MQQPSVGTPSTYILVEVFEKSVNGCVHPTYYEGDVCECGAKMQATFTYSNANYISKTSPTKAWFDLLCKDSGSDSRIADKEFKAKQVMVSFASYFKILT